MLKIYRSKKEVAAHQHPYGEFLSDGKTFLKVACNKGFIHIVELQLEGKKKMLAEDFLRGYKMS
jgi:methionyl-tRNA formyltransferase